ncbi:ABC transporter permease subunit [Gordonia insulae]|uniref:ABC transporter permease subunit n=1 Tax=Gordonia insulae TaxID=2420509 RepID=UPI001E42CF1A|nr:ABC transporter permease subunit [Gordonia insulae]
MAVPLCIAAIGPWLARSAPTVSQAPFGPSSWSPFGTDRLGRDVLAAALEGGRPLVVTTVLTVVVAYAIGSTIGLVAATTTRPVVEDLIMRPVDVLLCIPSLLVVLVVALRMDGSRIGIAAAVAAVLVPPIARFIRMASRSVVQSPAMETLRLQGVGPVERYTGYARRRLARPVAADVGVRLVAALYILSSANFLGIGFDTTSTDWAVAVAANKEGLDVAPWSVLLPAGLIVALALGTNLLLDERLSYRRRLVPPEQSVCSASQRVHALDDHE